jgi:hypothetical protein
MEQFWIRSRPSARSENRQCRCTEPLIASRFSSRSREASEAGFFNTIGPLRNEAEARQLPAAQRHLAGLMPQADASADDQFASHRAVWLEKLREAGRAPPG